MRLKIVDIDWGRYRHELPTSDTVELPGDWHDWFTTDEDVERLQKETTKQLKAKHGFTPRAWTFDIG